MINNDGVYFSSQTPKLEESNVTKTSSVSKIVEDILLNIAMDPLSLEEASKKCLEIFQQISKDKFSKRYRLILTVAKAGFIQMVKKEAEELLKVAVKEKKWDIAIDLQQLLGPAVTVDSKKSTVLHLIVEQGTNEQISLACSKLCACIESTNSDLNTPLHLAAWSGNEHAIEQLLQSGAVIDAKDVGGRTPLHLACVKEQEGAVHLLIANQANVNAQTDRKYTPIHIACKFKSTSMIHYLMSQGADINAQREGGATPLHDSIEAGYEVLMELAKYNPNYEIQNDEGKTAYDLAFEKRNISLATVILDSTLGKNYDNSLWTRLVDNLFWNQHQDLNKMISEIDVNQKNYKGQTFLHLAAISKLYIPLVKLLIQKGADVNARDVFGRTPLMVAAASEGNSELVLYLLRSGAEAEVVDLGGNTAYINILAQSSMRFSNLHDLFKSVDHGLTQEILDRKLLAHYFGIKGEFNLEDRKIYYTGLLPGLRSFALDRYDQGYYTQLIQQQELSESVKAKIPKEFLSEVKALESEILTMLQKIQSCIANMTNFGGQGVNDIMERFQDGLPSGMLVRWPGHAVGLVIDRKIARCNRGSGAGGRPGIIISTIGKPEKLRSVVKRCLSTTTRLFFTETIETELELKLDRYIAQKPQKVGNCGIASTNSMKLAQFFLQFETIMSPAAAEALARAIKQDQTESTKLCMLNDYIARHQTEQKFPVDSSLLNLIYAKNNTECGFHKAVRSSLDKYRARN